MNPLKGLLTTLLVKFESKLFLEIYCQYIVFSLSQWTLKKKFELYFPY